jgi:hypothetical protein
MHATVWRLATAVTQTTTVTPARSKFKDDSNIMIAHNSRMASSSRDESNNSINNTAWTPSKAGMLAKPVMPATARREANYSRDNRNVTASTAEGRSTVTRIPEIEETSQQHQRGQQQHNIYVNN